LDIQRSKSRKWHLRDRGGYRIVQILYGENYELTMEEVRLLLDKYEAKLKKRAS
jgi:hypothetical protein